MADAGASLMRDALQTMLGQFREGRPNIVLFTTFNFSASFFEANVLPLLAGNSVEELKGASEARSELNAVLQQTRVLVVCDRSAHPEPKGDFRYGLIPVGLEKGRFHPKVMLMSGTLADGSTGLWMAVGSGNLSLSGWAINREVVGVTPVAAKHRSELQKLLRWLLDEAQTRLEWTGGGHRFNEEGQVRELLQNLLSSLETDVWDDRYEDALPSLHVSLHADELPLLDALTGGQQWDRATVVSPFWSEVPALSERLGAREIGYVPSLRPDGSYGFPIAPYAIPTPTRFFHFKAEAERYTHAKALLFERGAGTVLCIGSANFTGAAMLRGGGLRNVEAMLRYTGLASNPWKGLFSPLVLDRLSIGKTGEDGAAPDLPPFEADVVCDWTARRFLWRLAVHADAGISGIEGEISGLTLRFEASEGETQHREIPFRGTLPIRNFYVTYRDKCGEERRYQGLVTQVNAEDDELGYNPRPRLSAILALLRSLDPDEPEPRIRRRAKHGTGTEDEEEGSFEPSFDFFALFQATYKLRAYYRRHKDANPFSKAPQAIPLLLRAVTLQPAETNQAKIGRYVQLAEILDVVEEFGRPSDNDGAAMAVRIRDELSELEKAIEKMLAASEAFRSLFGARKVSAFLGWFRGELKKRQAKGASDVAR